jgi:murein DD-endopeptidase MepM/ murein hydrolase activator NlpD
VRAPRGRRAIGLGLLLPGLLLTHPGAADADGRAVTPPARKAADKTAALAERPTVHRPTHRKPRSRTHAGPAHQPVGRAVHVVHAGDSISRIAAHYRVTRKSLIDANKLERSGHLRVGQRLVVSGARRAVDGRPVQPSDAGVADGDVLLVRAGPRRVPTRLYITPHETDGQAPEFAWPVDGRIISPFGRRYGGWHAGMDIKAEIGTPILAAGPGVVITSGQERDYGRIIRIEHDNSFVTIYAHNLENLVEVGDRVSGGTIIGTVGRSGRASTPHLHFEVRYESIVYDPLHMLPARDVIELRPDDAPDMPTQSSRAHGVDGDTDE